MNAVKENNLLLEMMASCSLQTSYFQKEFPMVMPVEYKIHRESQPLSYVPVLTTLQELLNSPDVLEKNFHS